MLLGYFAAAQGANHGGGAPATYDELANDGSKLITVSGYPVMQRAGPGGRAVTIFDRNSGVSQRMDAQTAALTTATPAIAGMATYPDQSVFATVKGRAAGKTVALVPWSNLPDNTLGDSATYSLANGGGSWVEEASYYNNGNAKLMGGVLDYYATGSGAFGGWILAALVSLDDGVTNQVDFCQDLSSGTDGSNLASLGFYASTDDTGSTTYLAITPVALSHSHNSSTEGLMFFFDSADATSSLMMMGYDSSFPGNTDSVALQAYVSSPNGYEIRSNPDTATGGSETTLMAALNGSTRKLRYAQLPRSTWVAPGVVSSLTTAAYDVDSFALSGLTVGTTYYKWMLAAFDATLVEMNTAYKIGAGTNTVVTAAVSLPSHTLINAETVVVGCALNNDNTAGNMRKAIMCYGYDAVADAERNFILVSGANNDIYTVHPEYIGADPADLVTSNKDCAMCINTSGGIHTLTITTKTKVYSVTIS